MAEKIIITYEILFDVVRREKGRDDLQKMEPTFYNDMQKYIQEKTEALANTHNTENVFAIEDSIKRQKQLENIKLLLKELYERREKKIISLALIKSRTHSSVIDTSALLEEEKALFQQLCDLLSHQRTMLFQHVQSTRSANEPSTVSPFTGSKHNENATISLIHYVPKFVGRDLEVYGPFEPGETVTIPRELALVLIAKGRAKEITENQLQS